MSEPGVFFHGLDLGIILAEPDAALYHSAEVHAIRRRIKFVQPTRVFHLRAQVDRLFLMSANPRSSYLKPLRPRARRARSTQSKWRSARRTRPHCRQEWRIAGFHHHLKPLEEFGPSGASNRTCVFTSALNSKSESHCPIM